jgi:hypothetical protein
MVTLTRFDEVTALDVAEQRVALPIIAVKTD